MYFNHCCTPPSAPTKSSLTSLSIKLHILFLLLSIFLTSSSSYQIPIVYLLEVGLHNYILTSPMQGFCLPQVLHSEQWEFKPVYLEKILVLGIHLLCLDLTIFLIPLPKLSLLWREMSKLEILFSAKTLQSVLLCTLSSLVSPC